MWLGVLLAVFAALVSSWAGFLNFMAEGNPNDPQERRMWERAANNAWTLALVLAVLAVVALV